MTQSLSCTANCSTGLPFRKSRSGIFYKINSKLIAALILICFQVSTSEVGAQLGRNSQEVWPSIDAYLRLDTKWRLYGTTAATKMNGSSYTDGAVGLFVDHFTFSPKLIQKIVANRADSLPGKFLWLRFGYQYSATPPSAKDPFKESMLVTEANARFYLPWKMLLTTKNRFDWRFHNGEFNLRYRPRLNVERDFKTDYLTFTGYGFVEYFANFGNSRVDRFRTQIGIEIRATKRVSYEAFWNHQFEHPPEVPVVDAFGMTLKLYLDTKDFSGIKLKRKSKEG